MKRVMLLGAMLAMVLMVAAPAVAQDNNSVNNSFNTSAQFQDQNCEVAIDQYNQAVSGDAIASGDGAAAGSGAIVNAPVDVVQQCVQAGDDAIGVVGGDVAVDDKHYDDGTVHYDDKHYDDGAVYYDDKGEVVYYDEADKVYYHESGAVAHEVYDDSGAVVYSDYYHSGDYSSDDYSASAVYSVLPDTGGASLIALGAGALLVAGGLLARRILK
ncbi:Hypothetical Protein RradSPS_2344 [Rubrobacter radiotolerans]|uniref:Gram-positive cocci surface proteins LPxTG domain-containing protein n=1 Tax=Rubrobacter radiotolerans TaxID=42256 RepID=A0A023X5A0_RUBRA|nr:hypothetical protein [Rubrobacter radiotolerans]AHY47627.1 Hypothetical Protein RradSPS_2344 [Rubrobacter radiotolerans]